MNRPIFIIVIGYIIGIIWGLYCKISIGSLYFFLVSIYIIINKSYQRRKFKIFSIKRYFRYIKLFFKVKVILLIIISSIISNIVIKYQNYQYENKFKEVQELEAQAIVISNVSEKEYYNRYKVKVCNENIRLYINVKKDVKLEYGDKIEVGGQFIEPKTKRNYRGFDYKEYLKTQKIYGTLKVKNVKILEKSQGNKLMQKANRIFLKIEDNIQKTYSTKFIPIIQGIILGDTRNIDEETKDAFSDSNISHVLAVSGMHISYIILLATSSTKIIGKRKSKIFASMLLVVYMFITGFSISVVRACIMGILSCMAFVLYRKSDTLNNISIAMLIILINNPYNIESISFLLTFGGTLGIVYFKSTVEKAIKSIKIRNRKWKYLFIKIQQKSENIISILAVSISAQIVIAPIMAMYFNKISIGFLLTNFLLSYIIGIVVIGGFIQSIVAMFSIKIGAMLAHIIEIPLYGIILISKINFGNFTVITPQVYQIIFYYIIIFIIKYLYQIFNSKKITVTQKRVKNILYLIKYKSRTWSQKVILIVILIFVFFMQIPKEAEIHFIDVGQGDSTLIITPSNKKVLIDGGGSGTYDVGENILIPYLLDRGIKRLDYVIVSHTDFDHISRHFKRFKRITSWKSYYRKTGRGK